MKTLCTFCGRGTDPARSRAPDLERRVSGGLCAACERHLFARMGMPLRDYLDGFGAPIVVVDVSGTVLTANRAACAALDRNLGRIEGYRGGEVFECVHARLPEGCGNTVHCTACGIRRTVMDTLQTGQSRVGVPAYLDRETPGGVSRTWLLISTEKAGALVLLTIDEVGSAAERWTDDVRDPGSSLRRVLR